MARNKASTEEGVSSVQDAATPITGDAPAEEPATPAPDSAPASSNEHPASSIKPLKPGLRMITLAQARAHHAAKHLGQA